MKARITQQNLNAFLEYVSNIENMNIFFNSYNEKRNGKWNYPDIKLLEQVKEKTFYMKPFFSNESKYDLKEDTKEQLKKLISYMDARNLLWKVVIKSEDAIIIKFSGHSFFYLPEFVSEFVEENDYSSLTAKEMSHHIGGMRENVTLPAEIGGLSVQSVHKQSEELNNKIAAVQEEQTKVKNCKTEELAALQDEINKMEQVLKKRKTELMAEIHEKMAVMEAEKDKLSKQLYMLESQIYTMRSYSGETLEIFQVRAGRRVSENVPIIINQKLMYLDEDLARLVSIYQKEIAGDFDTFEEALQGSDDVFDSFCPQDKCITFFRLSKNASYNIYVPEKKMYSQEELLHGDKMGFVIRDGENGWLGWMDESWREGEDESPVTFTENLIYSINKKEEYNAIDNDDKLHSDDKNNMLSRVFALSVLQGILDSGRIILIPEKVNIARPGQYIKFNFATAWVEDVRFGDFSILVENINKFTRVKDTILLIYDKFSCSGRGEANRAWDVKLPEGVYPISIVEKDDFGHCSICVSGKKRFSTANANANVIVRPEEYINISYMNSIWMKYYIQTKRLGKYSNDYAKLVKYFKRAAEVIEKREQEEIFAIKMYFSGADQVPEWQIKLSHWKLKNQIRFITDFQAKRVANYLQNGKFYEMKNLFQSEPLYSESLHPLFSQTAFESRYKWSVTAENGKFGYESEYYYDSFYIDLPNSESRASFREDLLEENRKVIAEELPELLERLTARIKLDEEKMDCIRGFILNFLQEHEISAVDLKFCSNYIDMSNLTYRKVDTFTDPEIKHIQEKVITGPSYITTTALWKLAYMNLLQDEYSRILYSAKVFIHKRWLREI